MTAFISRVNGLAGSESADAAVYVFVLYTCTVTVVRRTGVCSVDSCTIIELLQY